jgi:DHA3 family macrolide efflux protein-like MFS transporter
VVGGIVLAAWGGFRKRIYTALTALSVEGLAMAAVGIAPARLLSLAVASMFVVGFMNALVNGPFFALLQGVVAPDKQGRVFNLAASVTAAAWPLSLAVAGPVADAVGVRPWFVVGGVTCAVVATAAFFVPAMVGLEENGHAEAADALRANVDAEAEAAR